MKWSLVGIALCFATGTILSAHSFPLVGVVYVQKRPPSPPWVFTSSAHARFRFGTTLAMVHPADTNGAEAVGSSAIMAEIGSINATATEATVATVGVSNTRRVKDDDSESILKGTTESETMSSNSTTSSTTTAPGYPQARTTTTTDVVKRVRKHAGVALATVGFASSATRALLANHPTQLSSLKPLVDSLMRFLKKSGIDLELSKSLNFRLLDNVIILARVQNLLLQDVMDIRDLVSVSSSTTAVSAPVHAVAVPSHEEALRYMKYATAAYGDSMIRAANLDVKGDLSSFGIQQSGKLTKTRVSEHINVPEQDIVAMDVEYGGDSNHLRHFVAVDHDHQKVVLAIRGTFTISELVVDAAGFSRPFCGGEAHSEMANMAERVWQVAGPVVKEFLTKNKGYDLVLTGHSLGAGVACLLNILLCFENSNENGFLNVDGRQVMVKCFAYASPPVFAPKIRHHKNHDSNKASSTTPSRDTLELSKASLSCTNYIHEMDVVPFLSVDSIRHFFKCIAVLEKHHPHKWWSSWLLPSKGARDFYRDSALLDAVQRARTERLRPKPGAPLLAVPAATNVWIRQHQPQHPVDSASTSSNQRVNAGAGVYYDQKLCDPMRLATLGITLDMRMLQDHFPSRYEHALHHFI